jgi:flavodoxin
MKVTPSDPSVRNKVALAYYSRTGHTKALALEVARNLRGEGVEVEVIEIEPVEQPTLIQTGRRTITHGTEPIKDLQLDLEEVNLLAVGTPLWVRLPTPYVRRFIDEVTDLKGIPVVLFATCSKRDGRAGDELRELVRGRGGRPFEYHVWRIHRDGPEGIPRVGREVVASVMGLLPSAGEGGARHEG